MIKNPKNASRKAFASQNWKMDYVRSKDMLRRIVTYINIGLACITNITWTILDSYCKLCNYILFYLELTS